MNPNKQIWRDHRDSEYPGTCWQANKTAPNGGLWKAQLRHDGRQLALAYSKSRALCAFAYQYARELIGQPLPEPRTYAIDEEKQARVMAKVESRLGIHVRDDRDASESRTAGSPRG